MKDARTEALKDETFTRLMTALQGDNIESAARLADIYVSLCNAGAVIQAGNAAVGFSV